MKEFLLLLLKSILASIMVIIFFLFLENLTLPKVFINANPLVIFYSIFITSVLFFTKEKNTFSTILIYGFAGALMGLLFDWLLNFYASKNQADGLVNLSVDGVDLVIDGKETEFQKKLFYFSLLQDFLMMASIGLLMSCHRILIFRTKKN
ncbi:hypothetical protein ACFX58_19640 [Sphingomonas sp. NCPPB 2930]